MGAAGLYLMFCSGIPSFLISFEFTPSRLTFLPTIGVCFFVCAVLEHLRVRQKRSLNSGDNPPPQVGYRIGLGVVFVWMIFEAITLSSQLHQRMLQYDLDQVVSERIVEIYSHPKGDETFFLNAPKSEKSINGVRPAFETNWAHAKLWSAYGLGINSLDFQLALRLPSETTGSEMKAVLDKWRDNDLSKVVPFYISDQRVIRGIRQVVVVDVRQRPVATFRFSAHDETRSEDLIDLTLIQENDSLRLLTSE